MGKMRPSRRMRRRASNTHSDGVRVTMNCCCMSASADLSAVVASLPSRSQSAGRAEDTTRSSSAVVTLMPWATYSSTSTGPSAPATAFARTTATHVSAPLASATGPGI